MIYGYCKESKYRKFQKQVDGIKSKFPDATIYTEKCDLDFECFLAVVQSGDTVVFECLLGFAEDEDFFNSKYMILFRMDIEIICIRQSQLNSSIFRQAVKSACQDHDLFKEDSYIRKCIDLFLMYIIREQINQAFLSARNEFCEMSNASKRRIEEARLSGKQIGQKEGAKLHVKKSVISKKGILKNSRDFNGSLTDIECMKLLNISAKTFYKYKKELREQKHPKNNFDN